MNAAVVITLCTLFALGIQAQTAYSVPFLGLPIPHYVPSPSVGQVVTSLSQITSFSFWVSVVSGPGGDNITAYVAPWSAGQSGAPLGSAIVSLGSAAFPSYNYVTATVNVEGLDPLAQYVLYFTFPPTMVKEYDVATLSTGDSIGGLVTAQNLVWTTGAHNNVAFGLVTDNTMRVNVSNNYAEGHGPANSWGCTYHTNYPKIQVNWQTLLLNTGFHDGAVGTVIPGTSCNGASPYAPYGTAAECNWYPMTLRYARIDLTGTNYKVAEQFVIGGSIPGGAAVFSNNNQTVDLSGTGDCGWIISATAVPNGEAGINGGGFWVHLARV